MARRDVEFNIGAQVEGLKDLERLAKELDTLGRESKESAPEVSLLSARLTEIARQQNLIDQFRRQRTALQGATEALDKAKERTRQLALEMRNTENPSRSLQNQFERSRQTVRRLSQAEQDQRVELQRLRGSLQQAGLSTRNLADGQIRLNQRMREASGEASQLRTRLSLAGRSTREMGRAGEETGRQFDSLRGNIGSLLAEIGGLTAIGAILQSSSQEATEFETRFKTLEQVIEATGGAAGLTAKEIREMSRELALATLGSVEGFERAATELLTFKSISEESFGRALELSQDLAQAGFGTLEGNAKQLGKALEDPILGLNSMRRSGLTFSRDQQKVIRALVETGEVAKAQAVILDAVAGQVGGAGRAAAEGLAGVIDTLDQRFEELRIATGQAINPELEQFYGNLSEAMVFLTRNIDSVIGASKLLAGALAAIVAQRFLGQMASVISSIGRIGTVATGATRAVVGLSAAMRGISFTLIANELVQLISLSLEWIKVSNQQAEALESLETAQSRLQDKLAEISAQTGVAMDSMDDFNRALEQGRIVFDEASGTYRNGAEAIDQVTQSVETASQEMPRLNTAYRKAAEEMVRTALAAREMSQDLDRSSEQVQGAIERLEIDVQQATSGIRTEFSTLADSFTQVVRGFESGSPVIDQAAQKLVENAKSAEEVGLAMKKLKAAYDAGEISAKTYNEKVAQLTQGLSQQILQSVNAAQSSGQLGEALAFASQQFEEGHITAEQYLETLAAGRDRMNELAAGTDASSEATERLTQRIRELQQLQQGGDEQEEDIHERRQQRHEEEEEKITSITSLFAVQREEFRKVSEVAATMYDRMLEKATKIRRNTTDFFGALIEATETTQFAIDRANDRFDSLIERLQSGENVTTDFLKVAQGATNELSILGKQKMDRLRAEIESARQRLQQLEDQAEQARESLEGMADQLQDELDRIAGNQEEIEKRRFQQQLERIAELERQGGETARREAARARRNAQELHEQKLANIRKEEEERAQRERERAQREKEREEERQRREERDNNEEPEETSRRTTPTRRTPQATAAAAPSPQQVTKVIRVEYGNGRSFDVPADQEDNLIDFIEMLERAKRVT
ncbi:hypothetical protein Nhal_1006 [Nitrosococcus halophilus Nc 4]|uniref:Uncharacterized protein n=1 Tax=Nitrosococcus halophilus (strain Nc4) TaxID=472759 RepID=D5BYW6_NITHN|nr:phage tail length tape measure family protein [Nitrosococcus halophilus]ADE14179.1 hypothetical protein Nhal_1006 [Nitrosococcus halophilus Nc 4]